MILLLLIVLVQTPGPTGGAWAAAGQYGASGYSYQTLAACEAARGALILHAKQQPHMTLISKCGTDRDVAQYQSYWKDEAPASSKERL